MYRVLVAVGAVLFEFQPPGGIATVFHGGVPRHAGRSLVGIAPALGTLQGNNDANAFVLGHGFCGKAQDFIMA